MWDIPSFWSLRGRFMGPSEVLGALSHFIHIDMSYHIVIHNCNDINIHSMCIYICVCASVYPLQIYPCHTVYTYTHTNNNHVSISFNAWFQNCNIPILTHSHGFQPILHDIPGTFTYPAVWGSMSPCWQLNLHSISQNYNPTQIYTNLYTYYIYILYIYIVYSVYIYINIYI